MTKKSDHPELPPQKPTVPIHWPNEPERVCGNCQHFKLGKAMKNIGDCHNLISGRPETKTGMRLVIEAGILASSDSQ